MWQTDKEKGDQRQKYKKKFFKKETAVRKLGGDPFKQAAAKG
ncbi:hypothetical protein [Sodalis sp. (in: enterobacteria)]